MGGYRRDTAVYENIRYQHSLIYSPPLSDDRESATYELAGRFTTFEVTVFVRPGSAPPEGNESMKFEVWVDGTRAFSQAVHLNDAPRSVTVKVDGARWLKIQAHSFYDLTSFADTVEAVWADATLG